MRGDHFPDTIPALLFKMRIAHIFFRQAPGMVFLPDQDSLFITEIQKKLIIGIMHGPNGVGSQILYQHQIMLHG